MHYTSSSPQSWASAKVQGSSYSHSDPQTASPSWSDHTIEAYAQPPLPSTWAPHMTPVPLPHASGSRTRQPASHGTVAPTLHPVLVHDPLGRLYFNVTHAPNHIRFKQNVHINLNDPAITPPTAQITLKVPGFPREWSFVAANPMGLTLRDVLQQIFATLQCGVGKQEFSMLPSHSQRSITAGFQKRTAGNPVEYNQGLKRIDWLGPNTFFVGLSRAADGSNAWEVNFVSQIA